jgi:hypothetical protein
LAYAPATSFWRKASLEAAFMPIKKKSILSSPRAPNKESSFFMSVIQVPMAFSLMLPCPDYLDVKERRAPTERLSPLSFWRVGQPLRWDA